MKSKYYDVIPSDHRCIYCGGTKDQVTFGLANNKIRSYCNFCRVLITKGVLKRISKKPKSIQQRITEYFDNNNKYKG
jgi:hypothetical protein